MKIEIKDPQLYEWLQNLQKQIFKQQDISDTRPPQYWCICCKEKVYTTDAEIADGWEDTDGDERVYYLEQWKYPAENQFFLTKQACEEHIARYGYRYPKGRPYCLCGIENQELTKLIELIKSIFFIDEENSWQKVI